MTKSELIDRLAAQFPQLAAKDAELAVKMILDAMAESLAKGERIEIRGFGSFGLNHRPPRTGRNPKSGEKVRVPEKRVPHFKAGKELRERVDFRGADLRHVVRLADGTDVSVRRAADALARVLPPRSRVALGGDHRFLSEEFALSAANVLAARGHRPILADGPTTSPALSW